MELIILEKMLFFDCYLFLIGVAFWFVPTFSCKNAENIQRMNFSLYFMFKGGQWSDVIRQMRHLNTECLIGNNIGRYLFPIISHQMMMTKNQSHNSHMMLNTALVLLELTLIIFGNRRLLRKFGIRWLKFFIQRLR